MKPSAFGLCDNGEAEQQGEKADHGMNETEAVKTTDPEHGRDSSAFHPRLVGFGDLGDLVFLS